MSPRRVFLFAGIYGLLSLLPMYFMEDWIGQHFPPAISHPEQYYGFVGLALAWQAAFLLIASDPVRYRPVMLAAILEKVMFAVPAVLLSIQGRAPSAVMGAAMIDLVLCALFVHAFQRTATATFDRRQKRVGAIASRYGRT